MIKSFYSTFGFIGALIVALLSFIYIIFWFAGLAGILKQPDTPKRTLRLIIGILFPPYPFIWLIVDMVKQYRFLHQEKS